MNVNTDYYSTAVFCPSIKCHVKNMKFLIGKYRADAGLTQDQVAEHLGISQGLYNGLESGKRRMNETYLSGLAKLYGLSPVQLIVDPVRDDPLYNELDELFRRLSPSERKILVSSAKGIADAQDT